MQHHHIKQGSNQISIEEVKHNRPAVVPLDEPTPYQIVEQPVWAKPIVNENSPKKKKEKKNSSKKP